MGAPPYMKLYWADYHQDTRHLSREEHGAYFLLIGEAWNRGGYLPDDDALLARWALASPAEWERLKPIVMDFFRPAGRGRWKHKRITEELAAYNDVSRKRKEAGRKGGSTKRGKDEENPEAKAEAIAQQKPTKPEPEPELDKDAIASSVGSDEPITTAKALWENDTDFLAAWNACTDKMRTRSSRKSAHAVWRQNRAPGGAKLAALRAYLSGDPDVGRTGGPGFHLWIRDKLPEWLDRPCGARPAAASWSGPAEVADAMTRAFGAEKGHGYLRAYCAWQDLPTKALLCSNNVICDFIRKEAGPALERMGVRVLLGEKAA